MSWIYTHCKHIMQRTKIFDHEFRSATHSVRIRHMASGPYFWSSPRLFILHFSTHQSPTPSPIFHVTSDCPTCPFSWCGGTMESGHKSGSLISRFHFYSRSNHNQLSYLLNCNFNLVISQFVLYFKKNFGEMVS